MMMKRVVEIFSRILKENYPICGIMTGNEIRIKLLEHNMKKLLALVGLLILSSPVIGENPQIKTGASAGGTGWSQREGFVPQVPTPAGVWSVGTPAPYAMEYGNRTGWVTGGSAYVESVK